jgi:uncharacterized protein YqeY
MKNKLQNDLVTAMKNKDSVTVTTLRSVKTAITIAETAPGASTLTDADVLKIIQKLIKQREDAAEQYVAAGRPELAENEIAEANVMKSYLPKPLSDSEVEEIVKSVIAETGASSMKDMGKVMGIVNKNVAGRANGSTVATIVKRMLQ